MFHGRIIIANNLANKNYSNQSRRIFHLSSQCTHLNFYRATIFESKIISSDLFECSMREAKIIDSTIYTTDFDRCNLNRIHFKNCKFSRVNFISCKLNHAIFENCSFECVDFIDTEVQNSKFSNATFKETFFCNQKLRRVVLDNVTVDEETLECLCDSYKKISITPSFDELCPMKCPKTGEFYAYKKVRDDLIVKLLIPEDARRSSAVSNKCRCDKAKVVEILDFDGRKVEATQVRSMYDPRFIYTLGEMVFVSNFDTDRFNECAPGIHFFMSFEEARDYY